MREHFVTLHDFSYLPIGYALYQSLMRHCPEQHLTVVCMDEETHQAYGRLGLPNFVSIPPTQWLTDGLAALKEKRSHREFCWTMASQSYDILWGQFPEAPRVTYLDADLFFFDSPMPLLIDLQESGKSVLITEHGFAPEYDQTETSGRFCVQFVTFQRNLQARIVLDDWKRKCADECNDRSDGKTFGDQMYLNTWPQEFAPMVHISPFFERMLAPWNVDYLLKRDLGRPIFYHFHGLRILSRSMILAWSQYRIGARGANLYEQYCFALRQSIGEFEAAGIELKFHKSSKSTLQMALSMIRRVLDLNGQECLMRIP